MSSYSDSDEETMVNERPSKRARISIARPSCKQILLEEINLEIALRERLRQTIQSRITWALLLQEQVSRASNRSNTSSESTTFRDASLDALETVEAPCNVIFSRTVRPVKRLVPVISTSQPETPAPVSGATTPQNPPPRTTRGQNRVSRPPPKKLLFLRNTATRPPQVVKLACPDCSRTDFSSLQGLLNHCRLKHRREFGSHDECVQSSAVLVEDEPEQKWVTENGAEVAGISLPGLRRLFEIAVGGDKPVLPVARPLAPGGFVGEDEPQKDTTPAAKESIAATPASLLTRTLGHHEDTPALAPFLGRAPKPRRINVYEAEEAVDILDEAQNTPGRAGAWRARYAGRSEVPAPTTTQREDEPVPASQNSIQSQTDELPDAPHAIPQGAGSRFHILARVAVEDLSLWIPPEKRLQSAPQHTHRWRLAITSPSYSLPLNSFVNKITIRCLSDPPPSTLAKPFTLEGPPFTITSTTDRPFLANLEFSWVASDRNGVLIVEHWVELDPLRLGTPVSGDQQVFDVELDRRTELLPTVADRQPAGWEVLTIPPPSMEQDDGSSEMTGPAFNGSPNDSLEDQNGHQTSPEYGLLRSLLNQVPLTLKDVKGRLEKEMPYHVAATPMDFLNLVHGRRKAVEWSRARTLRGAYETARVRDGDSSNTVGGPTHPTLTTADVYRWLESEGHFPRRVKKKISLPSLPLLEDSLARLSSMRSGLHCHRCGLHIQYHQHHLAPTVTARQDADSVSRRTSHPCPVFVAEPPSPPMINVGELMRSKPERHSISENPSFQPRNQSWTWDESLAVAEPSMVLAIQKLLRTWQLSCFRGSADTGIFGRSGGDLTKSAIEGALNPAAILSLIVRSVAKRLLQGAVAIYRQDEAAGPSQRRGGRQTTAAGQAATTVKEGQMVEVRRLLTPSHIMRLVAQDREPGNGFSRAVAALLIGGVLGTEEGVAVL